MSTNPSDRPAPGRRPVHPLWWAALVALLLVLALWLLPVQVKPRDGEPYVRSQSSLRQILLALVQYHDTYGTLPPAVVTDGEGKPLYSWRVLVLPFLEQRPVYDRFHLDEPWDSPHNLALLHEGRVRAFQPFGGSVEAAELTRYQVLVGPGTAFERPGLKLPEDFPDGPANTILAVEAAEPVPWSKPADLAYDPGGPLPRFGGRYTKPVHFLGYEVRRVAGFNAVFADGSIRFIPNDTDERTLRALLTRNGGESVDLSKLR